MRTLDRRHAGEVVAAVPRRFDGHDVAADNQLSIGSVSWFSAVHRRQVASSEVGSAA